MQFSLPGYKHHLPQATVVQLLSLSVATDSLPGPNIQVTKIMSPW